jgi:nucleoside-diphosphate-sugar epimerase
MRTIRKCNVAVTGGAGFLGSHLVNHLIDDRQCKVVVIDNLIAGKREFVHKDAIFEHHDITGSEDHLRKLFTLHQTQYVLSYASRPYVPDSYDRPLRTFDVNAMGAIKVMNAAQEAGCEGILSVSSAEIYGGPAYPPPAERLCPQCKGKRYLPPQGGDSGMDVCGVCDGKGVERLRTGAARISEETPVEPHSSYGAAKAAIDFMVQARWREAKTPCIALRQFNCVGERETHPYIVPEIIGQLARQKDAFWKEYEQKAMTLRRMVGHVSLGNNSYRDFLYAGDAVRMAVELLERGEFGGVYNLGSEDGIKMYALAEKIGGLMGFGDVEVVEDAARKRPWEIWHLQSDNSKVYSVIESRPQVSLDEALRRTIAYYRENGNRWCWE